jgi:hypothetical protein
LPEQFADIAESVGRQQLQIGHAEEKPAEQDAKLELGHGRLRMLDASSPP